MSSNKENIGLIFGTRPEIIKLSPVIRFLEKAKRNYFVLHTGQHYSYEMDAIFFKELELPEPKHKLSVHLTPSMGHGHHTGRMLAAVEEILQKLNRCRGVLQTVHCRPLDGTKAD